MQVTVLTMFKTEVVLASRKENVLILMFVVDRVLVTLICEATINARSAVREVAFGRDAIASPATWVPDIFVD
jgi:hypothetical protein